MRPAGFAARFPALFHVADHAALPSIREHGLCSAEALCRLLSVPQERRTALLRENRDAYAEIGPGAALRWQGMRDAPLARRLVPGMTPAEWRHMINGHVFLFARLADAARLRAREAARNQVVLRFATADLVAAGLALRACRYNNGYIDRRSLAHPRLRGPADYVPIDAWTGPAPKEVTVAEAIPPAVGFTLCSLAGAG